MAKTKKNKKKSWQENILLYIFVSVLVGVIGGLFLNVISPGKKEPKVNIKDSKMEKSPVIVDSPGTIFGENITISSKSPTRHLTRKYIFQIEEQLKIYNGKNAIIFYQINDPKAKQFASEISEFLKSKGLEIKGFYASMFRGDSKVKESMFIDDDGILTFSIESQ